jgi:uncharacterized membrane protein
MRFTGRARSVCDDADPPANHSAPRRNDPDMHKGRLEAFSDGVLAIVITIMVLELHAPHEPTLAAVRPLAPVFLGYLLSFVYVGIYWNNHHHLFQASSHVTGAALWANLHLLFWLSLVPFTTGWLGQTGFAATPVAVYGLNLLLAALAYWVLVRVLIRAHGADSKLARAVGRDRKGKASLALYAAGVALAPWRPWLASSVYAVVAVMWLIPDRRIERVVEKQDDRPS